MNPEEVTPPAGDLETEAAAVKEGAEAEAKIGEGKDESVLEGAETEVDDIKVEMAIEVEVAEGETLKRVAEEESVG